MRDLSEFVTAYDDALTEDVCLQLIANFERLTRFQHRNGAGVREGLENSGWTEMNLSTFSNIALMQHFDSVVRDYFDRYNRATRLTLPITPVHKLSDLMMKRYSADIGDSFQVHFDAIRAVSNRYLVFLWYLNEVPSGGETFFPDLGLKIAPKTGRLIVFPPYWMFQHAGLPPQRKDKYIVSTYAIY